MRVNGVQELVIGAFAALCAYTTDWAAWEGISAARGVVFRFPRLQTNGREPVMLVIACRDVGWPENNASHPAVMHVASSGKMFCMTSPTLKGSVACSRRRTGLSENA